MVGKEPVETRTPEMPEPSTGTARTSVQVPLNYARILERWSREGSVRDIIIKSIHLYTIVYGSQVGEEQLEDGGKIPVIGRSNTANQLFLLAQERNVSEALLVRVGASVMVKLLSEEFDGSQSLYDAIFKRAQTGQRRFVEEVALLLKERLAKGG